MDANNSKIPLSKIIKDLHEKLQEELKMYRYETKASSIVHQVAENADAVEKVLSKPKKKKQPLEEKLASTIGKKENDVYVINFIDDEQNKEYNLNSTSFASILKVLFNNQLKNNHVLETSLKELREKIDVVIEDLAEYLVASAKNAQKKNSRWKFNAVILNKINPEITVDGDNVYYNKEQINEFFGQANVATAV